MPNLRLNGGTLHNGNASTVMTVAGAINAVTASNLDLSSMTNDAFNAGGDRPAM